MLQVEQKETEDMRHTARYLMLVFVLVTFLAVPASAASQKVQNILNNVPLAGLPGEEEEKSETDKKLEEQQERIKQLEEANKSLDEKLKQLEEQQKAQSLQLETRLLKLDAAQQAAQAAAKQAEEKPAGLTFKPSIAIFGDANLQILSVDGKEYTLSERTGFYLRRAGLILGGSVDPYAHARVYIGVNADGVELGEAYITWTAIPRTNITVGKFYQAFGRLNNVYEHQLHQFAHPLILNEFFGGPLNSVGVGVDVMLPAWWADEETLTMQLTTANNERMFSGKYYHIPTGLVRLRSFWQAGNTDVEFGLSAILGPNNGRGLWDDTLQIQYDETRRLSVVAGGDLTVHWSPSAAAKYEGFTWRSEFMYAYKELATDDNDAEHNIVSWGGYTYFQYRFLQRWTLGVRGELLRPFAEGNAGAYKWQVAPYASCHITPFVKTHLEYNVFDGSDDFVPLTEHRFILQVAFSLGTEPDHRL